MTEHVDHYLKSELYARVASDPAIFEFLQAGSLDGIWYWDLEDPSHEWMSPRFWEVLGYDPATKPHRVAEWRRIVHPDDLALAVRNLGRHCEDPAHEYDQVVRCRRSDGSTAWIRCRGTAIRDETGRPVRMFGTHDDITAEKEARDELARKLSELERTNEELEHSNKELTQFAYVASHDLREPLRMVSTFTQLLADEYGDRLDGEAQTYMGFAIDGAKRMERLVRDLLAYARLGTVPGTPEEVDAGGLVDRVISDLAVTIEDVGARVERGRLPVVVADPGQLYRVFVNLVANALKFRRADQASVVRIDSEERDLHWEFRVADNGIGIDPTYGTRIFSVFQRLHEPGAFEGTGIGLAVVERVVTRHGGRVWLDAEASAPGRGATFRFTLPRPPDPQENQGDEEHDDEDEP